MRGRHELVKEQGGPSVQKEAFTASVLGIGFCAGFSTEDVGIHSFVWLLLSSHPLLSTYSGIILVPGYTARKLEGSQLLLLELNLEAGNNKQLIATILVMSEGQNLTSLKGRDQTGLLCSYEALRMRMMQAVVGLREVHSGWEMLLQGPKVGRE